MSVPRLPGMPSSEGDELVAVKPTLTDTILHIDLVSDIIFSCCSPISLFRVGATCRLARAAIQSYMRYIFNINRRLERFFPDPCAFRSLQARTGTLISGSTAVQFFDRSFYESSDLDLYTHTQHRREVGEWLIQAGYTFSPARRQLPTFEQNMADPHQIFPHMSYAYRLPGVSCIFDFTKRIGGNKKLKVQLIVAKRTPFAVILGFHSTCVMNAISYEKAYCLYPRATLEERRSLISCTISGASRCRNQGIKKYIKRGWKMHYKLPSADLVSTLFRLGHRYVDDDMSWIITLDTTGVEPPLPASPSSSPMTHDPIALANWELTYRSGRGAIMIFGHLEHRLLRYSYLITAYGLRNTFRNFLDANDWKETSLQRLLSERVTFYDAELLEFAQEYLSGSAVTSRCTIL